MSKWKKYTKAAWTIGVIGALIYDLIAIYFGGVEASLSRGALDWPIELGFCAGYIMGHLFWPQYKTKTKTETVYIEKAAAETATSVKAIESTATAKGTKAIVEKYCSNISEVGVAYSKLDAKKKD